MKKILLKLDSLTNTTKDVINKETIIFMTIIIMFCSFILNFVLNDCLKEKSFLIMFNLKKTKKSGGTIIYGRLVYLVKRQMAKDKPYNKEYILFLK